MNHWNRDDRRRAALLCALPIALLAPVRPTAALASADPPARAAEQDATIESAERSKLAPIALPAGTYRVIGKEQVASVETALQTIAKERKSRVDAVEVLLWQEKAAPRTAVLGTLKEAGYHYEQQPAVKTEIGQATLFVANPTGNGSRLLGLWVERTEGLILAWGTLAGSATPSARPSGTASAGKSAGSAASAGPIVVTVEARTDAVNIMGAAMPHIPSFPKLEPKPGLVRGYVYDTKGKPVKGARLGVRSTLGGGFYSGGQGKTDANGYYEVKPPVGAAHFYCAGVALDYGTGLAAMGLHPADGDDESFATPNGLVRNFVLLPYGVADRAGAQDNPRYGNNYYGGHLVLDWRVGDEPSALPANAEIEVTLTPDGPLVDGNPSRVVTIRKKVGELSLGQLYVNNIPAAVYHLRATLVGGGPLHIKETGPYAHNAFGLDPKEASGEAVLMLRPASAKADMAIAAHGNWEQLSITLTRP